METDTIINEGGQVRTITGKKAVNIFAAKVLMVGINLYLKTGMQPSRMYTPTAMRVAASSHTGNDYKRGRKGLEAAAVDLKALLEDPATFDGVEVITR